jgi:shikimate dehydrogenase
VSPAAGGREFLLLGHPVAHSLSPRLCEAAFAALGVAAGYGVRDLPPDLAVEGFAGVLASLAERGVSGLNVTSPFKGHAARAAAALWPRASTPAARAAGAANCLRLGLGGYEATNTDGAGFLDFAAAVGLDLAGARVVLLGAGGSAAGLAPALTGAGAAVEVVTRRLGAAGQWAGLTGLPAHARGCKAAAEALAAAGLVINCTTLGGAPDDELPCEPAALGPRAAAVDMRYSPPATPWVRGAAGAGRRAWSGLGPLVYQAAHSLRYWLGVEPPLARLREVVGWDPKPWEGEPS